MYVAAPLRPEITGKLPGYLSPSAGLKFEDVPNGLAAISKVPAAGWAQILAYMAFCETSQDQSPGTAAAAGDFGFKVLTSSDPAEKTKKLAAELANGRLAMMAILLVGRDNVADVFFIVLEMSNTNSFERTDRSRENQQTSNRAFVPPRPYGSSQGPSRILDAIDICCSSQRVDQARFQPVT